MRKIELENIGCGACLKSQDLSSSGLTVGSRTS
jgi:hypothetical protein